LQLFVDIPYYHFELCELLVGFRLVGTSVKDGVDHCTQSVVQLCVNEFHTYIEFSHVGDDPLHLIHFFSVILIQALDLHREQLKDEFEFILLLTAQRS